jgi:hypothetical protein
MKNKVFNLIYFTALFLISYFLYHHNLLNADEGLIINNTWQILNGQRLYVDIFEIIAPGSFYLLYLPLYLFGANYSVAIIISLLFLLFGAYGLYLIINLLNKQSLYNYLVPLIFILSFCFAPVINHNTYFAIISIWLIYSFLLFLKTEKTYLLFISGMLSGLGIIFLQHKGLLVLLFNALFIFLYFRLYKRLSGFNKLLAFLVSALMPVLLVLFYWPIKVLWSQLIVYPFFNYWETNKVSLFFFFFYILVFFILFLIEKKKNKYLKYLFLIQAPLLISAYTQPDHYHLIVSCFPLLIISAYYNNIFKAKNIKLILYLLIVISLINFRSFVERRYFNETKWYNLALEKCKSDYIYVGPFIPNMYYELKKINPTKFNVLIENYSLDSHFEIAKNRFKESKADCAILVYYPNIKYKFKHSGKNALEEYIRLNYTNIYNDGVIYLYHKNHEQN